MANKEISVKISADSKSAEKNMVKVTEALNGLSAASSKTNSALNKSNTILVQIAKMFGELNSTVKTMRDSLNKLNEKPVQRVGDALERAGRQARQSAQNTKEATSQLGKLNAAANAIAGLQVGGAVAGIVSGIAGMGVAAVQSAAQMRQYEIAFQTMLKSAEAGTQMLRDLQQFAAETPFDVPGVVSAGQQLMAFGFQAKEIVPMLTSLGDAASGLGLGTEGVSRLAYALGQMRTSGKLNAQDMMQLTSAGVSAWDMLAQAAGKSVAEIKDMCSKGMIDSKEAVKIIVAGMNDEFGGMMDKTSNEVAGLLANIEETAGNTSAAIGKYMTEAFNIKGILKNVSDALGEFQQKMQTATDQGKSFTNVLKECVPGSVIVGFGALAAVIGGTLVAATVAAVTALGAVIGLTLPIVAGLAAIGAAIAAVVVYWDEIVDAFNAGVNAILDLITMLGTAIAEGFLGIMKFIASSIGDLFAEVTGEQDNWFNNFASMLGDALKAVEDFARSAIAWFNQVFAAKSKVMNDSYWQLSMANSDDDNKDGESDVGIPKQPAHLFIPQAPKSSGVGSRRSGGSTAKQENTALKAAQEENKIKQERLKIENEYVRLKLKKEKDLFVAQNAIAKQYGTDAQKLAVELAEIEFNKKQDIAKEELAYKEQCLATESALREAMLKGDAQKEIDMLNEKLNLLKETHQYTLDNISQTAANSAATAQMGYDNKQIGWQAGYNAADTVGQMTMANDKWKEDATAGANQMTDDQEKLETLTAINQKYDEQQQKINTISKIQQTSNQLAKDFAGAMSDWITGAQSFGDAMKNILKQLIAQLIQAAIYATIVASVTGGGGGFAARWSSAFGKGLATGGEVSGPGTGTSDSIPAMLSNGEYVLNAQAVDALGVPFLNGLNTGRFKGFASGGLVGSGGVAGYKAERSNGTSGQAQTVSLSMNVSALDAASFGDFLNRGGLDVMRQALYDNNRNFASEAGTW